MQHSLGIIYDKEKVQKYDMFSKHFKHSLTL